MKIWKYIENYGVNKCQYCFANISAKKAQIFMKFYMVFNYDLLNLSFKFYADRGINARAQVVIARTHILSRLRAFMNLARVFVHLSSQHSDWPPYKISWRSELSLRRYLQNNTGVCLILNFQCILHIFMIWASKFLKNWKIVQIFLVVF